MRFLHSFLRGLDFCFSYTDDILVALKYESQHIRYLKQDFQRLQDAGLVIKVAKCQFLQTEVDFVDHHISVNDIEPSKERIKVIEYFKLPETVKELRRYLGVINFYHWFIPNAAYIQVVLNNYLKGKSKNVNNSKNRMKPCFSDNSPENDIESSNGEDTPNKPAEVPEKKIKFAPLTLPTSTRATRGGRQVRLPVRYH
ncbi:transposon Tf2-12 polyprotein [Trichonephila inaurata madagascariensis]|uniref:Transposon Tf2-12 polyprotein n=1 Tax=Trichonephila inaurata madagascariensis TaxID=2747483 RepID=A0A8X6MKK1_9ARAC|nr:transposon Tf2-12 polyprotein [Trichonephila inaurata madagascariensis]